MDAAERDQLKCPAVLELIPLDTVDQQLREIHPTLESHPEIVETPMHSASWALSYVQMVVKKLIICRNEARESAKERRAIEETRELSRRLAFRKLGTSEFVTEVASAKTSEHDSTLVTVETTYKTRDDRTAFIQITLPK